MILCGLGELGVRSFRYPSFQKSLVNPTLAKISRASSTVGRRKSGSSREPYHRCDNDHT